MRSALRTSIAAVALTGALLVPATATAFAATTPTAASVGASDDSRYEGTPVYIGEGLVAVLRNKAEGPEAWIRYVGTGWKPGDVYMVRVMDVLDRSHLTATVEGLHLTLTKASTSTPVLTVTKAGTTTSYPLPKATAGTGAGTGASPQPSTPTIKPSTPITKPSTPATKPATSATKPAATVTDVKPQTAAQTAVVPKGAVAAGAEITAEDTPSTTTLAAGAGLLTVLAALGTAALHRTRRTRHQG
ncbi:hypothetical protein [Streptomyces sp. G-G2]|uniref:hypothetical protein n=1 Tax=Streptomyces sp. G-G2 TaxID=3046201 RepID=UPI0024BBC31C|nr:hypothetical protein [Streptomyces sp. G-G2]MDJ0385702.1 hypothetical protein [Streptomyces sp. G-G2]